MSRLISAIALSASLCACAAPGGLNTPHATLERAETLAENAYTAAVPFMTLDQQRKGWADLQAVRQAYNAGQDITALVTVLMSDLPKAKP